MRTFAVRLSLVGLSFCFGLVVFYVPERAYRAAPSIWLPATSNLSQAEITGLPTAVVPRQRARVEFVGNFVSSPVLVEMPGTARDAARCPELFAEQAVKPSACIRSGTVGNNPVFTISRRYDSLKTEVFLAQDGTLLAANGFYGQQSAVAFMRRLVKVPRRDVSLWLQSNESLVANVVIAIQAQQDKSDQSAAEAYRHIPFDTAMPAVLPADWVQQLTRIEGPDPWHPAQVSVYYQKGPQRVMSLTLVPQNSTTLGAKCGPLPDTTTMVDCSRASGKDYFIGGINQGTAMSWLIFRPVGNAVAILQVSAYNELGQPLALSSQDIETQKVMADSLLLVDRNRFRGAIFAGGAQTTLPELQPRP